MQDVFDQTPEEKAKQPVGDFCQGVIEAVVGEVGAVRDARQPDHGDDPPGRQTEGLEEVAEERRRGAAPVVARAVDLVQVERLAETAEPDLHQERLVEVEELVRLVVGVEVGVAAQVLGARHARPRVHVLVHLAVDLGVADGLLDAAVELELVGHEEADERVVQHLVGRLGVGVRVLVLQDGGDVLAGPVQHQVLAARVRVQEVGHVVDVGAHGDVAGLGRVVRLDLGLGQRG